MSIQITKKIDEQHKPGTNGRATSSVERQKYVRAIHDMAVEYPRPSVVDIGARLSQSAQFVWLVTGILELLFALRILLKVFVANPDNYFARITYDVTNLFLWPFHGFAVTPAANGMMLEIGTLFAMPIYVLIASGVVKMLYLIFTPSSSHTITMPEQGRRRSRPKSSQMGISHLSE